MIARLALAAYWIACYVATHVPVAIPPKVQYRFTDTLAHLGMYGILGGLFAVAVPAWASWRGWAVLAAYGVFDELTQLLVNRHAELADWAADAAGAALGIAAVTWMRGRRTKES